MLGGIIMKKIITIMILLVFCLFSITNIAYGVKKISTPKATPDPVYKEITMYDTKIKNNNKNIDKLKLSFITTYDYAKKKIKNIQANSKKLNQQRTSKLLEIIALIDSDTKLIKESTDILEKEFKQLSDEMPFLQLTDKRDRMLIIIELQEEQIKNLKKAIYDMGLINKI